MYTVQDQDSDPDRTNRTIPAESHRSINTLRTAANRKRISVRVFGGFRSVSDRRLLVQGKLEFTIDVSIRARHQRDEGLAFARTTLAR